MQCIEVVIMIINKVPRHSGFNEEEIWWQMSKRAFTFLLQRSELEMYVSVAKCISEMADSEIDRIVQISKVMMVFS